MRTKDNNILMYSKKHCMQLKLGNPLKQLNIRNFGKKFTLKVPILPINKAIKLVISKTSKECKVILREPTIRK